MPSFNDPQARARRDDVLYFLAVFFLCAGLFMFCGSVFDGSLVGWLLTLRLPVGW